MCRVHSWTGKRHGYCVFEEMPVIPDMSRGEWLRRIHGEKLIPDSCIASQSLNCDHLKLGMDAWTLGCARSKCRSLSVRGLCACDTDWHERVRQAETEWNPSGVMDWTCLMYAEMEHAMERGTGLEIWGDS